MTIRPVLKHRLAGVVAFAFSMMTAMLPAALAQRVALPAHGARTPVAAVDAGAVPESQMLTLTVRLRPTAERQEALEQEIAGQQTAGSAEYRRWVTPSEFAAKFGATDEQVAAVSAWLESQGLGAGAVSAGKTRLTVTGTAARVQSAFGVELRRYSAGGTIYFANVEAASVPVEMSGLVAGISGLDDKAAVAMQVKAMGAGGVALPVTGADALSAIEAAVDANAASMLSVSSSACSVEFGEADYDSWRATLRQAEAQGMTVLAARGCKGVSGSFPASLAEVAAVAPLDSEAANPTHRIGHERDDWGTQVEAAGDGFLGIAQRPGWQFAEGLPADGFRKEPDLTAEVTALAQTLAGIAQKAGTRLGNVAPVLYELAKTPGLYTQTDGATAGTWERATGLGDVDLKELAAAFPRGTTGTSSLLVASNYAPYHGKTLTLTATVTSTGGSGVPTGTVTFTSTQQGTLGTATLNGLGVATFTSNSLAGGTYTLTSVYSGDGTYTGSTSGTATVTVVGESSIITATVAAGTAVGGNATVNIAVTSASGVGTPSGTVTVAPQGTVNTSTVMATLSGTNGTGTATVSLPVYQAGTFTLLVSCTDPDQSFTCYSPVSAQMTVAKGVTATSIVSSPVKPVVGQPYTLTATVAVGSANAAAAIGGGGLLPKAHAAASSSQPATGSVEFMDGTTVLGTASVTATANSGVATYSGTATTGTHNFTAAYSGDQNYAASTSVATTTTTTGLPTSTSLTASSYAISVGQAITFYSTVYSPGVPSTMTGTVTYSAAAQGVLGTGTVSGGLATLTLSSLPAGTYNLTATYSGDATFAGSTSTTLVIVTVAQVPATLAGSITPVPLNYGSNAVLLASASFAPGVVGGPQGTLQASVTGVAGDTFVQPLIASSVGPSSTTTFTFGAPVPGRYSVVLSCTPQDTFPCAGPVTVPMTVLQGITSTTLSLSPAAPLAGAATTLTATIQNLGNNPNAYTFTGSVQFLVNNKLVGTAAVTGSTATLVITLPAGPAEEIEAIYTGDTNWLSSTSNAITVSVAALVTATTLSSNVTQVIAGEQVVLTATVTGTATGVVSLTSPTGLVDFYDTFNGVLTKLGSAALASYGANASIATFNATGLTTGTHVIYAVYTGDTIYSASTSGTITLGLSNFSVSFVPATMTVKQGQSGSATLLVNFQGGFGGTVAFGCTPPANVEITCSFNPAVLNAAGSTTLTVTTVAPSARSGGSQAGLAGRYAGGVAMALLLMWVKPRRQRLKLGLLLTLLAVVASGVTGCTGTNGASSNGGTTNPPPPVTTPTEPGSSLGTQILTITTAGSDGTNTVRHDYQYQVTVQ